jgi:hypothetical protein
MRNKKSKLKQPENKPANFVAKHMNTFNRASVETHSKGKAKRGESKHKPKYL